MTPTPHTHVPTARQLWIKRRCIAVESQFRKTSGRLAFALRYFPLLAILILAYWNASLDSPRLSPWIATPVAAVAAYLILLVLSHRFHDLGKSGANLLQIAIPAFIWLWIGDDLMAKLAPRIWKSTAGVLAIWPVIVSLQLCALPGAASHQKRYAQPAADH